MTGMTVCVYLWCAWFAIWLLWALRGKRTQQRESARSRLSYTVLTVAAFWLMFSGDVAQSGCARVSTQSIPGLRLSVLRSRWRAWRLRSGRAPISATNWSSAVTVKVGHELVRSGPYRWVRHPIYSGMILAMLGTALVRHQVRGLIAVVLLYAGFKIKSKIEEQTMAATFGAEYAEYASTTGAIVPRLRG